MGRRKSKKRIYRGKTKGKIWRFIKKIIIVFLLSGICISIIEVAFVRFFNPPITTYDGVKLLISKLSGEKYTFPECIWCPISEISPYIKRAVLAGEDQRFLTHFGFDVIEAKEAISYILKGKRPRGASTITMQTARTLFLWPERSYLRKSLEIYYALLMEVVLTKRRILELYLNTVDWGDGIRGVESASIKYFGIHAWQLTKEQSARLASILPSPHRWSPLKPNRVVQERKKRILKSMHLMPSL